MRLLILFCLTLTNYLVAQSVTSVELYGPSSALQAYNGLGTNITPQNQWEFAAAQAAHITWGRFECGWSGGSPGSGSAVEIQNMPANTSGGFQFPSACGNALSYSNTYGVRPLMVADYGPPFATIASGTATSTVSSGATTVAMTVTSGSLSGVVNGQACLAIPSGWISSKHGYCGTMIASVSGSTITLTTAATQSVSSGTALTVNILLYPPVIPPVAGNYASNVSLQRYGAYVQYLKTQMVSAGSNGLLELWNEPPWPDECWDAGENCYDAPPLNGAIDRGFGVEVPAYVSTLSVNGVQLANGYTDKTADGSLFNPNFLTKFPSGITSQTVYNWESSHPYPNNPEDDMWLPACIQSYLYQGPAGYSNVMNNCGPVGGNSGSSDKWAKAFNSFSYTFGGLNSGVARVHVIL